VQEELWNISSLYDNTAAHLTLKHTDDDLKKMTLQKNASLMALASFMANESKGEGRGGVVVVGCLLVVMFVWDCL
jgi:hypothetical protein